jgi:hypothetical protein
MEFVSLLTTKMDIIMFSFFKSDPVKKLKKEYELKVTEAMNAQRNGDIKSYSSLISESEKMWTQIQALETT